MGVGWGQYCGTRLKYCQQCSVSFKSFTYHTVYSSGAHLSRVFLYKGLGNTVLILLIIKIIL